MRFAANLGFLFTEHAFLDRFAAAAGAGFRAVEFANPYAEAKAELAARLRDNGLECILFNLPMVSPDKDPRSMFGMACRPERVADFRASVDIALEYAAALGTRRVNCIAGVMTEGDDAARCEATLVENLRYAAGRLQAEGVELVIEPLNTHDRPGFFVATTPQAAAIIAKVGHPNLGLQCDLYHTAMMGDDPSSILSSHRGIVRHIQVADAPGRGEPGTGNIDFARHFATIEAIGYGGWVSAEYRPSGPTRDTLGWFTQVS